MVSVEEKVCSQLNRAIGEFWGRVGDSVEMIAGETEEVFCPQAKRHSRVGIMRADHVEKQEEHDEKVGAIRKLQPSMRESERGDKDDDQNILQHPGLSINRMYRRNDPDQRTNDR